MAVAPQVSAIHSNGMTRGMTQGGDVSSSSKVIIFEVVIKWLGPPVRADHSASGVVQISSISEKWRSTWWIGSCYTPAVLV